MTTNNILSKENKALLAELVRTDFKLRYQGSVLGYAWSLLRPLLMFGIYYVVFAVVFRFGDEIPNFPIYLLLGIVLWNFFQETTSQSLGAIVVRADLVRKIKIPRWMIVVSAGIGASINLALNFLVIILFAAINGLDFLSSSVYLPLFILEIYLFALGLSLILSALFVKYRDIGYIWDVVLQAGFYATPILYPLSLVTSETAQRIMFLNPMAQSIQGARNSFVTPESVTIAEPWGSNWAVLLPLGIVVLTLIIGVLYFSRQSKTFAENL